MTLLPVAGTSR